MLCIGARIRAESRLRASPAHQPVAKITPCTPQPCGGGSGGGVRTTLQLSPARWRRVRTCGRTEQPSPRKDAGRSTRAGESAKGMSRVLWARCGDCAQSRRKCDTCCCAKRSCGGGKCTGAREATAYQPTGVDDVAAAKSAQKQIPDPCTDVQTTESSTALHGPR